MDMLSILNTVVFGGLSLASIGLILSDRFRDGIVIKTGLIVAALGFGSVSLRVIDGATSGDLDRSILLIGIGLFIIIAGYAARAKLDNWHKRIL